jgi:hypothetical protein
MGKRAPEQRTHSPELIFRFSLCYCWNFGLDALVDAVGLKAAERNTYYENEILVWDPITGLIAKPRRAASDAFEFATVHS